MESSNSPKKESQQMTDSSYEAAKSAFKFTLADNKKAFQPIKSELKDVASHQSSFSSSASLLGKFTHASSSAGKSDNQTTSQSYAPFRKSRSRLTVPASSTLFGKAVAGVKETSPQKKPTRRQSSRESVIQTSPEIIKQILTIVCKGIPGDENNYDSVYNHFKQFGAITRISCNNLKQYAIIHFKSHDDAESAKKNGLLFGKNSTPVSINWYRNIRASRKKSEVEEELSALAGVNANMKELPRKTTSDVKRKSKLKPNEGNSTSSGPDNSGSTSLKFMSVATRTAAERCFVLNARDHLIRSQNKGKKKHSGSKCKTYSGTCPDMCPEKERYARQEKKQLSIFELHSSSQPGESIVDHALAIKEYSRSSADQEEPLPFELRPTPVLCLTMDYLICNLMDLLDQQPHVSSADWFDFLWNRTRAIRKDITQQHLCNVEVVALIEKCARFHIYCSERLCEESMTIFDPKINNENLTKCMQTLKHFYYDLGVKDVKCSNEAEFRAYDILLNLNRGEILREVQQLSPDVRKSSDVNYALNILTAFNCHNYTKFFKLLNQASFLHFCILHRYFTEVRTIALHIIVKAYCPSNHTVVPHPLVDLMAELGFESETEAISFCSHHGLVVDRGESTISLNRNSFFYPESAPPSVRSLKYIKSKMRTSVGEIVNGGPLPENPKLKYSPHNSFRNDGILHPSAYDASDQSNPKSAALDNTFKLLFDQQSSENVNAIPPSAELVLPEEPSKPAPPERKVTPIYPEIIMEILNETIFDDVDEIVSNCCYEVFGQMHAQEKVLQSQSQAVLADLIYDLIRNVGSEVMYEEEMEMNRKQQVEAMKRKEREQQFERITACITQDLTSAIAEEAIEQIAFDEIREIHNILACQRKERCMAAIKDEIIAETIIDCIKEIASNMHYLLVIRVLKMMEELQKRQNLRVMKKYFKLWQRHHFLRNRLKKTAETFPTGPCNLSIEAQSKFLGKDLKIASVDEICTMQARVNHSLDLRCLEKLISSEIQSFPLNIPSILQDNVAMKLKNCIPGDTCFWKLAISLPADDSYKNLCQWIKRKFTRGIPKTDDNHKEIETLTLMLTDLLNSSSNYIKLGTCVKLITGTIHEDFSSEVLFLGTLGVLLFMIFNSNNYTNVLKDARSRLECLLNSKPAYPAVPVLLFAVGSDLPSDEIIMEEIGIEAFIDNQYVSDVDIIRGSDNSSHFTLTELLIDAVTWIGKRCPVIPKVSSSSLSDFFQNHVLQIPLRKICEDKSERQKLGLTHQGSDITIALLNEAIKHMTNTFNVGSGLGISWPPPEFCHNNENLPPEEWSSETMAQYVPTVLETLHIKNFQEVYTWGEAIEEIWDYISVNQFEEIDNADLVTRTEYLLERTASRYEMDLNDFEAGIELIPWTDIVLAYVDYMTNYITCLSSDFDQVYFIEDDIVPMKAPSFWLDETAISTYRHNCSTVSESLLKRKLSEDTEESPPRTKYKLELSNLQLKTEENIEFVLAHLNQEMLHQSRFDERLHKACEESSDHQFDTAMISELEKDGAENNFQDDMDLRHCSLDKMMLTIKNQIEEHRKKSLEFDSKLSEFFES